MSHEQEGVLELREQLVELDRRNHAAGLLLWLPAFPLFRLPLFLLMPFVNEVTLINEQRN